LVHTHRVFIFSNIGLFGGNTGLSRKNVHRQRRVLNACVSWKYVFLYSLPSCSARVCTFQKIGYFCGNVGPTFPQNIPAKQPNILKSSCKTAELWKMPCIGFIRRDMVVRRSDEYSWMLSFDVHAPSVVTSLLHLLLHAPSVVTSFVNIRAFLWNRRVSIHWPWWIKVEKAFVRCVCPFCLLQK